MEKNYVYVFNKIEYEFRLTRGARKEIESASSKFAMVKGLPPKIITALFNGQDLDEDFIASLSEEEQAMIITEVMPIMIEQQKNGGLLDEYEIGYILLKNDIRYKDTITQETFDELVADMELEKGFEETALFFSGVRDMVFTTLDKVKKAQDHKQKKKTN